MEELIYLEYFKLVNRRFIIAGIYYPDEIHLIGYENGKAITPVYNLNNEEYSIEEPLIVNPLIEKIVEEIREDIRSEVILK